MVKRFVCEIMQSDVGKAVIGDNVCVREVLGKVLQCDVGKWTFVVDGVLQVESVEQRDVRRAREARSEPRCMRGKE